MKLAPKPWLGSFLRSFSSVHRPAEYPRRGTAASVASLEMTPESARLTSPSAVPEPENKLPPFPLLLPCWLPQCRTPQRSRLCSKLGTAAANLRTEQPANTIAVRCNPRSWARAVGSSFLAEAEAAPRVRALSSQLGARSSDLGALSSSLPCGLLRTQWNAAHLGGLVGGEACLWADTTRVRIRTSRQLVVISSGEKITPPNQHSEILLWPLSSFKGT